VRAAARAGFFATECSRDFFVAFVEIFVLNYHKSGCKTTRVYHSLIAGSSD
jgi:hypothetical protein